jgi:hypothetical protein
MLHEKLEPASPVTAEWLLFELGLMHLSDGITGYQLNNILAVHNKTELACLSCGCQSSRVPALPVFLPVRAQIQYHQDCLRLSEVLIISRIRRSGHHS